MALKILSHLLIIEYKLLLEKQTNRNKRRLNNETFPDYEINKILPSTNKIEENKIK